MIKLRFLNEQSVPRYMTKYSAGADLYARETTKIPPGAVAKVAVGVWIDGVDWTKVPTGFTPEVQIRARSGLAFKNQVCLANGVGTVDADYPDEIAVLLINHGSSDFNVEVGDRVAQLVLNLVVQIPGLIAEGKRMGGFGSTNVDNIQI